MIERVARALTPTGRDWQEYRPLAIWALEAMREPTDEMIASAQERYESDLNGVGRVILGCVFMAAIDAALTESERT